MWRISPSCRSYCGNPKRSSKPLRNNRRSQTRQDEQSSGVNVGRFGLNRPESTTNMDNAMTRALILGATALTLSAGVASAQVAFVSPGRYGDTDIEDYNNPNETMAQRVGLAPTLRRLVTPPLYGYAPVPTTKSAPQATGPTAKWVTAPQATGPTAKWVTAPQPGPSNSSSESQSK